MILWLARRFRIPSRHHYVMIAVAIVAPAAYTIFAGYLPLECPWVRALVNLVALLIWAVFVVVVVAMLTEHDSSETTRAIRERIAPLESRIDEVDRQHGGSIEGIRSNLTDLEERTQRALRSLDATLPPPGARIQADIRSGVPTMEARGTTTSGGSRWGRCCAWLRCWRRRIWKAVWGSPGD